MPRGKEFCPFENDSFAMKEFEVVDGTLLHKVEPLHRATDGVLVREEDGKVIPVNEGSFGTLSERKR